MKPPVISTPPDRKPQALPDARGFLLTSQGPNHVTWAPLAAREAGKVNIWGF